MIQTTMTCCWGTSHSSWIETAQPGKYVVKGASKHRSLTVIHGNNSLGGSVEKARQPVG